MVRRERRNEEKGEAKREGKRAGDQVPSEAGVQVMDVMGRDSGLLSHTV